MEKPFGILAFPDARFPKALGSAFPDSAHLDVWNNTAIALVSDELTAFELDTSFIKTTGKPAAVKAGVKGLEVIVDWFSDEGYKANRAVF